MKKMPISQKTAKKRTQNADAKQSLLGGFVEETYEEDDSAVYTDGHGREIEMEDINAGANNNNAGANNNNATSTASPAKSKTTPAAVPASPSANKDKEKEEVVDQYPIPQSVKAKMGQFAPRYVCMGDGDGGKPAMFVQFLYTSRQEASAACVHLMNQFGIMRKKEHTRDKKDGPNRVFSCAGEPAAYPVFSKMNLFMVRVHINDYEREFGQRPTVARRAFEQQLNGGVAPQVQPQQARTGAGLRRSSSQEGLSAPLQKGGSGFFSSKRDSDSEEETTSEVAVPISAEPLSNEEAKILLDEDKPVVKKDDAADGECLVM